MQIYAFVAAIFIGFLLGLIGGGGSILTVPVLVYMLGINPIQASGYSLFIVGLTALVGGLVYFKKNEVDVRTGLFFAVPSFIGVYTSTAFIIPELPEVIFSTGEHQLTKPGLIMLVFSVLMLLASMSMIRAQKYANIGIEQPASQNKLLIFTLGFCVGVIAGFVGAGGGFLIIPALVFLVHLSMRQAIGTSLMIIAIQSLLGFFSDLKNHPSADWKLLITFSLIALIGLVFGIRFSKTIPEGMLKKIFGYFVMILGALILYDQFRKM